MKEPYRTTESVSNGINEMIDTKLIGHFFYIHVAHL